MRQESFKMWTGIVRAATSSVKPHVQFWHGSRFVLLTGLTHGNSCARVTLDYSYLNFSFSRRHGAMLWKYRL